MVGLDHLIEDLHRDRESAAGRGVVTSVVGTWTRFHHLAFGTALVVLPSTVCKLTAIAAFYKARNYRSFANHVSAIQGRHIEAGFNWTEHLEYIARWVTRSVLRGIGPARQSHQMALDN